MQFGILGHDAPELTVMDWINGAGSAAVTPFRLDAHKGKVRVLFAFQAWCPSCHTAGFPALKSLLAHYNGNPDVVFAAVQTVFEGHGSNGPERRFEMLENYAIALPVGQDEAFPRPDLITDYRTGGTPWFIIINRDGKVIHNGYRLDLRKGVKLIDAALDGAVAPAPSDAKLTVDTKQGLFKIEFPNGANGMTAYSRKGHVLDLLHTEIDRAYRGQGLGGWMMELVLEEIERQGLKARPVCTYARSYLDRYHRWHAIKA